jgi:hypothetical protein
MTQTVSGKTTNRLKLKSETPEVISHTAGAELGIPVTSIHKVEADGIQVFYRWAGDRPHASRSPSDTPGAADRRIGRGGRTVSCQLSSAFVSLANFRVTAGELGRTFLKMRPGAGYDWLRLMPEDLRAGDAR